MQMVGIHFSLFFYLLFLSLVCLTWTQPLSYRISHTHTSEDFLPWPSAGPSIPREFLEAERYVCTLAWSWAPRLGGEDIPGDGTYFLLIPFKWCLCQLSPTWCCPVGLPVKAVTPDVSMERRPAPSASVTCEGRLAPCLSCSPTTTRWWSLSDTTVTLGKW